jgi:phosphomannomutase
VLFRTSGTEALIRIYAEARDAGAVEARLKAIEDIVGLHRESGAHG